MINFKLYSFLALLLCLLGSCKSSEQIATTPTETPAAAPYLGGDFASNQAKVIGKIISIDETRETDGPCSKAACKALISISEISKKGSLFELQNTNGPILVSFAFTLAATTAELFPGMKTTYPGLKINDRFEAKIECRPAMNEAGFNYIIYEYKKFTYEK